MCVSVSRCASASVTRRSASFTRSELQFLDEETLKSAFHISSIFVLKLVRSCSVCNDCNVLSAFSQSFRDRGGSPSDSRLSKKRPRLSRYLEYREIVAWSFTVMDVTRLKSSVNDVIRASSTVPFICAHGSKL